MEVIRTRVVTPEYEEGFERAFGPQRERREGRARYVWDGKEGRLVEVSADYQAPQRLPVVGDAHYDGLRTVDGVDISSRTKHREYMKATGLTTADDFKETWAKAEQERDRFYRGEHDKSERREALGRALYELEKRNRK